MGVMPALDFKKKAIEREHTPPLPYSGSAKLDVLVTHMSKEA